MTRRARVRVRCSEDCRGNIDHFHYVDVVLDNTACVYRITLIRSIGELPAGREVEKADHGEVLNDIYLCLDEMDAVIACLKILNARTVPTKSS